MADKQSAQETAEAEAVNVTVVAALDRAKTRGASTGPQMPGFAAAVIDQLAEQTVYYQERARRAEGVLRHVSDLVAGSGKRLDRAREALTEWRNLNLGQQPDADVDADV